MIKVVTVFLIGMMILALMGRLRLPKRLQNLKRGRMRLAAAKCPACGRYRIGSGPCRCGAGD